MPALAEYMEIDSHHPEAAALYAAKAAALYVAEAAAVYAAHTFLSSFLMDYPRPIAPLPQNAHLQFVLDTKRIPTEIEWTFDIEMSPFDYLKADDDIIQAAQKKNKELPLELSVSWV